MYGHSRESSSLILRRAIQQVARSMAPLIINRYSGHTHFTYAYLGNNKDLNKHVYLCFLYGLAMNLSLPGRDGISA